MNLGNNSRVLITGGAGLVGSHLVDACLERGAEVVVIDNFVTGTRTNLADNERLSVLDLDICDGIPSEQPALSEKFDAILHFACPASPVDFATIPLEILRVDSIGTLHALERAKTDRARFLVASTSEVYGDPLIHPQEESYWGNVNPIGVRSCYDEAKRFSEAATVAYARNEGVNAAIVRIFNTYGPRMRPDDGRVVPNFINQALANQPLTVHGDGSQTRSLCYIDDLVRGLMLLLESNEPGPINLGAEYELSVREMAEIIIRLTGSTSSIEFTDRPADDPERRRPDLTRAKELLGYEPHVNYEQGLKATIDYFATS
ncbi:NAD-dependent epimerase/dehydratase family protein [Natronoglycomyces albus]|uniref:GDP-mannose 4,6-dehydratase n=1 Tax=Natronoglycomyces albus TaxID=2811108 RepID=A0A895XUP7_9ACTN|nr:NAD-dependent epimerase/dehydratase family protein [Natronoglycomyces albus]QSB07095.1 GDP-mannose 4,6-dehydratase [Natronoglycomyces albus]